MPEWGSMAATTRRNHRVKRFGGSLRNRRACARWPCHLPRVSSQALLNGDTKTEIQTQNHYRDFIACDPILSTLFCKIRDKMVVVKLREDGTVRRAVYRAD